MQPNWDDVPDVTVDGRSMVPFPDPHPEFTEKMWERWRADRAEKAKAAQPQEGENAPFLGWEAPTITSPAQEFDEPCGPLAVYVKLAHKAGWNIVELSHALSSAKGKPYTSGEKEGILRPDREMEIQWLKIEKAGVGRAIVSYPLNNGKVEGQRVYRSFNGKRYGDADMKRIIRGEYEAPAVD